MKKITCLLLIILGFTATGLHAQAINEFRIQAAHLGNTDAGLRKFYLAVETNNAGKWSMLSKAYVTTGRNFQLAEVVPDSTVGPMNFRELLKNKEFYDLYELTLNGFMDRIEAPDINVMNVPDNKTSHRIFQDETTKNIFVSIKAGERDKEAIIRICPFDNTKMIVINRSLKPFSGNLIEVGTGVLSPGNYLVAVSTPTETFSEKFLIY